jgi:DNA-binding transcriptional ArsR family regulator
MVNRNDKNLDRIFQALADSTRRRILLRVARSSCTVSELAKPFSISAPAISRHLKVLEDAQMIVRVKSGKFHRMRIKTASHCGRSAHATSGGSRQVDLTPLREVMDWVELFEAQWENHLLKLKHMVESNL